MVRTIPCPSCEADLRPACGLLTFSMPPIRLRCAGCKHSMRAPSEYRAKWIGSVFLRVGTIAGGGAAAVAAVQHGIASVALASISVVVGFVLGAAIGGLLALFVAPLVQRAIDDVRPARLPRDFDRGLNR